jgi:predicted alpha/beta-fold hydrolase
MYVTNTDPHRNSAAYRLEEIEAPTLIINAVDDPLANYEDAQAMARRIPQAQFVTIQRGGHIMVGNDNLVEDRINGFLAES